MALFFFVVGLEIKREVLVGELSSWKKAVLPVAAATRRHAAAGRAIRRVQPPRTKFARMGNSHGDRYRLCCRNTGATGSRVPAGLKIFLTALAIADDLGAVLVIALFYSDRLSIGAMIAAGVFLGLIVLAARLRVKRIAVYAVLVIAVWLAVLASGIHATVAGILLAMVVPVRGRIQPKRFFARRPATIG